MFWQVGFNIATVLGLIALGFGVWSYYRAKEQRDYLRGIFRTFVNHASGLRDTVESFVAESGKSNSVESLRLGAIILHGAAKTLANVAWTHYQELFVTIKEDQVQNKQRESLHSGK